MIKELELSKKQSKRFTKLCKKILTMPECSFFNFEDDGFIVYTVDGTNLRAMHWYEFCLRNLSKIMWEASKESKININYRIREFQNDILHSNHPIDFLWEFYKSRKLTLLKNEYK